MAMSVENRFYLNEIKEPKENNDRYFSVDFGINNLMTVGNNIGLRPFIVKGKALKSFNQYFNKTSIQARCL